MVIETRPYTPPIPQELDNKYRQALSKVLRWEGGPLLSTTIENNLDHVDEMLVISDEIQTSYPNLAGEVDFETVNHMIYLHDGGEIITGDLCLSRPDFKEVRERHKRRERAALRYLVRSLNGHGSRETAERLVRRYHNESPQDKEGLTTRLIDKIQAARFGLKHVYPSPKTNEEKVHVARAVGLIHSVARPLKAALSPEASSEIDQVVSEEWTRIKSHGFIV